MAKGFGGSFVKDFKNTVEAPFKAVAKVPGEIGDAFQSPSMKGVPKDWQAAVWQYGSLADAEAKKYKQPNGATLIAKVIMGESHFNPGAVSSAGAKGAGQFMDYTRARYLQRYGVDAWSRTPDQAVHAVALFLNKEGLARYNPGGGQGYINYILGQPVSADTQNSALVPDAIEGATDDIGTLIHALLHPSELAALLAKTSAYFLRFFGKALWDYGIAPPWHWTERSIDYYFTNIMSGEGEGYYYSYAGIVTMLFWGMGYGILWADADDGISMARSPRESVLGRTIQSAQLGAARRKLRKPGEVHKDTPNKPEPTESTATVERTRTLKATRRRTVSVTNANGGEPDERDRRREATRNRRAGREENETVQSDAASGATENA